MADDLDSTRRFEPAATPPLMREVTDAQRRFAELLERHEDERVAAMCELLSVVGEVLGSGHPSPGRAIRHAASLLRGVLGDAGA
jgi:hypothetical protein